MNSAPFFGLDPFKGVPGPSSAGKGTKTPKLKYRFKFLRSLWFETGCRLPLRADSAPKGSREPVSNQREQHKNKNWGPLKGPRLHFGWKFKCKFKFQFFFRHFQAELGPGTALNGSSQKNGPDFTQNQPRRPILRPCGGHFLVQAKKN